MTLFKLTTTEEIGRANREAILHLFHSKPGIMSHEIAQELGLSRVTVGRHIEKIRASWGGPAKLNSMSGKKRPDKVGKKVKLPNLFKPEKRGRKKTVDTGVETGVYTRPDD